MSTPHVTSDDPVELLVRLVETPSVSGSEGPIVDFIEAQLTRWGLEPVVSGRNVWCAVEGSRAGPTLLLESHIDTVSAGQDWTSDPWHVERFQDKVQGLGANDAKGCAAAMMCTARDLSRRPNFGGTLVFAATCDEETGGEGLEVLRAELPELSAAVIGEPTTLAVATAQRGFMRFEIVCDAPTG